MAAITPATAAFLTSKDALLPDAGQRQLTSLAAKTPVTSSTTSSTAPTPALTLAEKRQAALQLVNQTLTRAYEALSSRGTSAVAQYQAFEPLTAEKVAGNILGFIERRLQLDSAEGATAEQLASRLEAGLSGFKKGFAEAQQKLEALSLLSPEVKSDIGKTYELVTQGIDSLRQRFVEGITTQAPAAEPKPGNSDGLVLPGLAASQWNSAQWSSASERRFEFELGTREGDKVKISLVNNQSQQVSYSNAGSQQSLAAYSGQSTQFSLAINGDLNADELAAINDLIGKVSSLAGQFYAGNLGAAWEQALALGFDEEQIDGYRLQLSQVEVQAVSLRESLPPADVPVQQARDLLGQLQQQWQIASIFPEPLTLIQSIVEAVDSFYAQESRFSLFIRERLESLQHRNEQGGNSVAGSDSTIA